MDYYRTPNMVTTQLVGNPTLLKVLAHFERGEGNASARLQQVRGQLHIPRMRSRELDFLGQSEKIIAMDDNKLAEVQEMLLAVTRSLVDHPEKLQVFLICEGAEIVFRIRTSANDVGKLIGVQGRTARALRHILAANSMRLKRKLRLDIDRLEEFAIVEETCSRDSIGL